MKNTKQSGTCICAVKDRKGRIWVAADRRASWSFSKAQVMPRPKLSNKNGVILAGTGDGFLCHLIIDILDVPKVELEPDQYVHGPLYFRVKSLLEKKGMVDKDKMLRIPGDCSAEIIIAFEGHCYIMDILNPDEDKESYNGLITIDEVSLPYTTGCGGEYAKGAIDKAYLDNNGTIAITNMKNILEDAIKIAALNSPGCDANIDIEHEV